MKYPNDLPAVLTYGGGTNSSAILVELIKRGYEPPALIIFADTGAGVIRWLIEAVDCERFWRKAK